MERYAKQTFLAMKNPYHTVTKVFPLAIDQVRSSIANFGTACYTGYKDTSAIPESLKKQLAAHGFPVHTQDRMALGGRAVDMELVNPITGRWMTGSSSGTALNVFYGINDLGVGTDGGGSVLAPAAALNLYGFISPLIEYEHMKQFEKLSTDGIRFFPSIGYIAREFSVIRRAAEVTLGIKTESDELPVTVEEIPEELDLYGSREPLIRWVKEVLRPGVVIRSQEGPVDVAGMGDTVFGHMGPEAEKQQRLGKKGLMRVANMCGASAVVIPRQEAAACTVFLCVSQPEQIRAMFSLAERSSVSESPLLRRYFGNLDQYF